MIFQQETEKLQGDILTTDGLLHYLPFLKEVLDAKELTRSQLDNFARDAASLRRFRAGDVICQEGDFGSTAYYLVSGRVEVSINNPLAQLRTRRAGGGFFGRSVARLKSMTSFLVPDRALPPDAESKQFIPTDDGVDLPRHRPVAELGAGEIFGEMTCRTFQPRSATITCLEDCEMVEMLRVILDMLTGNRAVSDTIKTTTKVKAVTFKGSPTFRRTMEDKYRARNLATHLRGVPMFAGLDEEFLQTLTRQAELVSHAAGEAIVTQDEPADAFYLVRSGMVKVSLAAPGGELVRTYLTRGDYFGEIGLLTPDGKRTTTCRALDQTDVVRIKRELFDQILEKYPAVRVQLKLVADARMRSLQSRRLPVGQNMEEFLNQGLFEAQNLLLIDLDKCTRCDACVTACAEAHDGVTRLLRDGLRYDRYLVATACRSCHDPLCMTQCPVGSIRRKETLEIQIESWCIGCSKCAELCPYGNINMHQFDAPPKPKDPAKPAATAAAPAAKGAPAAAGTAGSVAAKPAAPVTAAAKPAPVPAGASPGAKAAAPAKLAAPPTNAKAPATTPAATAAPAAGDTFAGTATPPEPVPIAAPAAKSDDQPASPVAASADKPTPASATSPADKPAPAAQPTAPKPAPAPAAAKPASADKPAPAAKPTAPAAKSAATPPPAAATKPAGAAPPAKPAAKKKPTVLKATTCDLCTDLLTPSCVYACPHDAAMRVDPARFFAGRRSDADHRSRSWLSRLFFDEGPDNRTTH